LQSPFFRNKVEGFLRANGLRMETLDVYYTLQNTDGDILAGAGLAGDVIKCVAVAAEARSEGLVAPLVSHILSQHGAGNLKVFTKPENEAVFTSLGFHVIARAPLAILMENGRGLEEYLASFPVSTEHQTTGVVVMNANPFTLGHLYLLQQAATQVDRLVVIPVKETPVSSEAYKPYFTYEERLAMIRSACSEENYYLPGIAKHKLSEENYFLCSSPKNQFSSEDTSQINSPLRQKIGFSQSLAKNNFLTSKLIVLEGSDYQISAATFPTYFLKDLSEAAETQMRLDLDLFARHIVPALGATVRFVGSEPLDPLTARYNALMQEILPIKVVEIPRLETPDQVGDDGTTGADQSSCPATGQSSCPAPTGHPVSASAVRAALEQGSYARAAALCPATTRPYLMAALAERALRLELDTPMKPGLVGPDGSGAHKDMDYALMLKAIAALRPYWSRMAKASVPPLLQMIGIEAEKTMKKATGGVNTHRGAIFALGLALNAHGMEVSVTEEVMHNNLVQIARAILCNQLTDSNLHSMADGASPAGNAPSTNLSHGAQAARQYGVKGAREMALEGYKDLWADWLPYYRRSQNALRTLLRIMSTLDDTCVIHRVGYERAQEVKREAAALLEMADQVGHDETTKMADQVGHDASVMPGLTGHLCEAYAAEGISPGGAADMLALTIFIDSLTN